MKKALITGINGQDGSYLAEFLLEKGYEVHGILKRNSVSENQTARLDDVYNLAAQSHVRISFDIPIYTASVTGMGVLNVFEACRIACPEAKIYQASSSEMFGNCIDSDGYQRETTPMRPVSPYGCAKVFAFNIGRNYRNSYNMFISNGILFNHESPRRGSNFVTEKVVKGACAIAMGKQEKLALGNLDASRDWGHAKDYVEAMWMMLQQDKSDDFVCSTGISHTVRDLCEYTFNLLDMDYKDYIMLDEKYLRPEELEELKGDSTKIREELGWKPKYSFEMMINEMVEYKLWNEYGVSLEDIV